jgi:methyl-accepting chemotaxis protein
MPFKIRSAAAIFLPGISLRRRVAFSLAIVRLILAPVILLSIFYLFKMGWIVDRIVSVDAPAATLSQQASIQMLEARRAERDFFLARDANDAKRNRDALAAVDGILAQISRLEPEDQDAVRGTLGAVNRYQQEFASAVAYLSRPGEAPGDRIESVVRNYEKNLNDLVWRNRRRSKAALIGQLRAQMGSFDTQITSTLRAHDPNLGHVADQLDASSRRVFRLTSALEAGNWRRVQIDHRNARKLLDRAELVLSVVSGFTIFLSVWVSFVLPRQVAKPLVTLKEAVDRALMGNRSTEFEPRGSGEVAELARSVQNLIAQLTAARQTLSDCCPDTRS